MPFRHQMAKLPSLRIGNTHYNCYLFFVRFPAELGPETRSNGPGSKHGLECTHNWHRMPILMPFRDNFLLGGPR